MSAGGLGSTVEAGGLPYATNSRVTAMVASSRRATLTALVACVAVALAPGAARAFRLGPTGAAFYEPPQRLLAGPHGSVIWARPVRSQLSAAARAYRVLYRSVSVAGKPIAVSGLIDLPKGRPPKAGWPAVSWTHGTVGVADACAPSRDPAAAVNAYAFSEFDDWLRHRYALVRTDYEGLGTPGIHPYLVGTSEARGASDIVRAARALDVRVGVRWIVAGHSQGGQAALFAAVVGPRWVPELSLRGAVAFAPASHVASLVRALPALTSKSPVSTLVALMAVGAATVDHAIRPERLFSDAALTLLPRVERDCVGSLIRADAFGSLAPAGVLRAGADVARLAKVLAGANPALRIGVPVLVLQGLTDGTVPPALTAELVAELRGRRDAVTYRTYPGVEHVGVVRAGARAAAQFFAARLR
jgi:pimeloyl-ACP methyl ester carboxylesterase